MCCLFLMFNFTNCTSSNLYFQIFSGKNIMGDKMNSEKDKIIKKDDPYRFDLTADFLQERYNKICNNKSRIKTEQKIRQENNN